MHRTVGKMHKRTTEKPHIPLVSFSHQQGTSDDLTVPVTTSQALSMHRRSVDSPGFINAGLD